MAFFVNLLLLAACFVASYLQAPAWLFLAIVLITLGTTAYAIARS